MVGGASEFGFGGVVVALLEVEFAELDAQERVVWPRVERAASARGGTSRTPAAGSLALRLAAISCSVRLTGAMLPCRRLRRKAGSPAAVACRSFRL